MARKIIKILTRSLLTLLILLIAVWFLIQFTPVQNWLVKQASYKLSKALHTEVTVKHVDFSLFNKMLLEGILVKDRTKDSMFYIGSAGVRINDWFFLKEKIELNYVSLEQTTIYLHRTDSVWNYQFLVDYFSSPSGTKDTTKKPIELVLKKIDLKQIHLIQKDEWRGETMEGRVGSLTVDINKFNLPEKRIDVNTLDILSPHFYIFNYKGNRPPKTSKTDNDYHQGDVAEHWNKEGWKITAKNVTIENGEFRNEQKTEREVYTYFDPAHLQFKKIKAVLPISVLQGIPCRQ